jgi:stearoyl-CoA desaturase (delta-9 desaturase)
MSAALNLINRPITLFLLQLLAHVSLVYAAFNFSLAEFGIIFFLYFLGACFGGTMTFHRLIAHRSWNAPNWFYYIGSLIGSYFLVGSPLAWANNHIAHHRYTDTDKDPHSPKKYGILGMFTSMFHAERKLKYVRINKFQLILHRYYFLGHAVILTLFLTVFGIHTTVLLYLAPSALVWTIPSLVNHFCHLDYGLMGKLGHYRNNENRDDSHNNIILGYLVFGEGFHNNHHTNPANPNMGGRHPWEIDIGWFFINLLEKNPKVYTQ